MKIARQTDKDRKNNGLLCCLRKHGRTSLTNISHKLNIPISTLYDMLKNMENTGLIMKMSAIINFSMLGDYKEIILLIKAPPNKLRDVESAFTSLYVNSVWRVSDSWTYVAICIFKSLTEFDGFVEKLTAAGASEIKELYCLKTLMREEWGDRLQYLEKK